MDVPTHSEGTMAELGAWPVGMVRLARCGRDASERLASQHRCEKCGPIRADVSAHRVRGLRVRNLLGVPTMFFDRNPQC